MDVEDSYEGAVRRLQRLEHAGIVMEPAASLMRRDDERESLLARIRDLEELASLACDDNERLERELAEARDQVSSLQRLVATLEESAESAAPAAPPPRMSVATLWPPSVAAPAPWSPQAAAAEESPPSSSQGDVDVEVDLSLSGAKNGRLPILVGLAVAGGLAVVLFALQPWSRPQSVVALAAMAQPAAAPPAPVVTAPAPAPVTPPAATAVAAAPAAPQRTVPAVVIPTAKAEPKAAPAPVSRTHAASKRRAHKHSQRADSKRRGSSHAVTSLRDAARTTDPLGGLNL